MNTNKQPEHGSCGCPGCVARKVLRARADCLFAAVLDIGAAGGGVIVEDSPLVGLNIHKVPDLRQIIYWG